MTIAPGETGSFEVFFNRRKVFSKTALDRFPEVNEVEEKVGELADKNPNETVAIIRGWLHENAA